MGLGQTTDTDRCTPTQSTSAIYPGYPSRQVDTSRFDLKPLSHQGLPPGMKIPMEAEIPRMSDVPVYMAKTELEAQRPHVSPTRFNFKQLHEIPDYEILEAVDRRITESNHPKVSIWWAQKNKKSPFKSWEQAQIALRQTFVDKARLTTVKVFTERGQQQRDESLRKFATRLHEAAQETSVPDATAVDIFLSGAYDKSRISSLQNAENPPKTLDECINYLRRRDIDVEITPEKEERSRSASPKSARMPARGQISSKPESVSWEGPVAELRRENQLMEARMMQKIPTVIASLMTTTQTNVQAPSSG
ncbi:unnamed protein product, partial [Aphanomyces euteiches]